LMRTSITLRYVNTLLTMLFSPFNLFCKLTYCVLVIDKTYRNWVRVNWDECKWWKVATHVQWTCWVQACSAEGIVCLYLCHKLLCVFYSNIALVMRAQW
jgi:hypothetical protein